MEPCLFETGSIFLWAAHVGFVSTGLAFKRKWQHKMKAAGKPYDKPNMVTGSNVQVRNIKGDHHFCNHEFCAIGRVKFGKLTRKSDLQTFLP
jgi:glutamate/tyrosine decarboxylase-like PLP-dependent enzyme